jgi:thiol-disulfide isomerase/thioredoxin
MNCTKFWNRRTSGALVLAVALAGCAGETAKLPPVTPATAQEITKAARNSGAKAVLVNIWASWCAPCRAEFPDLVKLQRNYESRGLKVIFVSWDDNADIAAKFLARQGVTSPSWIKSDSQNDQDFLTGIEPRLTGAIPATLIYDGNGRLREFWEGAGSYQMFEQKVQTVLGGQT